MPLVSSVPMTRTIVSRPLAGQMNSEQAENISIHHSPDMENCSVRGGLLLKRPGYSQFPAAHAAMDGVICGLFSTQDEENSTHFYAVTPNSLYKYDTATETWIKQTGAALSGGGGLVSFENSQNSLVWSDGVYAVQRIPFNSVNYAALSVNCPPARHLTRFANRLYLGYTVESGATKPFRVRRPVAADHTNWTGVGSGFTDLDEFPHQIRGIKKLGARMVVYTEQVIHIASRTEIAAAPARFDVQAADVGLLGPHTLQGWRDEHFFLGTDDFYSFNGAQPQELSIPVRDTLFDSLNPGAVLRNFALRRFDTKEYISFLCTSASTTVNTVWVYNKQRQIWYPWSVGGGSVSGPRSGCSHRLDDTATIDELVGTIDAQDWEFDTRDLESQYPAMLTGHNDGKVYLWSTQYKSDAGVAITARWTSKDFTAQDIDPSLANNKLTLKTILVSYLDQGETFNLQFSYSVDGGASWTSADTVTFTTSGGTTRRLNKLVSHQITGNKVRFKIEQTSTSEAFAIISFHVELEALSAPLYT